MHFSQIIDDAFNKIIVMDASARIKTLLSFDETIEIHPLRVTKNYGQVKLLHADVKSSKDSFHENRQHLTNYLKEIEHLFLNTIPNNEEAIIFCHKELKDSVRSWVAVNLPLRTIHVLNWGEHKATNRYKQSKHIISCGVLYRDRKEIASRVIAQTRRLDYKLVDNDVADTLHSEQAELLYQGFSRGNCRNTLNGQAGEQTIYLFHPKEDFEKVMPFLERVMPNAQVEKYKPVYLTEGRKRSLDFQEIGRLIMDYLISLDLGRVRITTNQIRTLLLPDLDSNSRSWRAALSYAKTNLTGWALNDRTFERI
jgi:hypothetical protein